MIPPNSVFGHLAAFSALLAHDAETGQMNPRDLQVISLLVASSESPEGCLTVGEVATTIGLSASHASRVVEKLVKRALIERFDSASDRRISLLRPTSQGHALDARVREHFEQSVKTSR